MSAVLGVAGLDAGYDRVQVLRGIDLEVRSGEVVVVLGSNGAGKTTLLRAVSGLLPHRGTVTLDGVDVSGAAPHALVRRGLSMVPQGRGTLAALSVEDNLRVGATARGDREGVAGDLERWYDTFPRLAERRRQVAGTLSGGEQQMLAIARAMMSRPRLLLCDEPSLGLAPLVTRMLFERLVEINRTDGVALLLVEQNADLALEIATRVYVLETGAVRATGPAADFTDSDAIRAAYLGL
ncbi:ABC transporter ATP-binding protein [Pseudonocardia petroleophila]|uniref:ABC transporter ATP-binding protein n=1 Tax=Pseudonocardia petroleophila TaxID=37331 RepID=A0A7G7MLT8_9PSEU|nr:ABC transporter ATP-binding protein [Pseudonocardia petroleophila]QNG53749.1 ABC transporter ATP-binding protein [Pseudonocardia petroleophila]